MRLFVYLARHGETDWNATGKIQGSTDIPLNEVGRDQARDLAAQLKGKKLGGIATSHLVRARETAEIVARALKVKSLHQDQELRERGLGVFEGLDRDECEERFPEAWAFWRQDSRFTPPEAESYEDFAARTVASVRRATEKLAKPDRPALVVTHGGLIKAFIRLTHPTPALITIPNAALFRYALEDGKFERAPEERAR